MTAERFPKVQLYLLGLLSRHGAQHGYQLKQRINDEVADFARIELANIYYHLARMERDGLVRATREQEGRRPERAVYSMTVAGEQALDTMLAQALDGDYWSEFAIDAALYFADRLPGATQVLATSLARQEAALTEVLDHLRSHRQQVLPHIPALGRVTAEALFRHHELHYEAELAWVRETRRACARAPRSQRRKS